MLVRLFRCVTRPLSTRRSVHRLFPDRLNEGAARPPGVPMSFPSRGGFRALRDAEGIRRAREEHQMPLCRQPPRKSRRNSVDSFAAGTAPTSCAAASLAPAHTLTTSLPLTGSWTVFPTASTVELTRADTGKAFRFLFGPIITYSWVRQRGRSYNAAGGHVAYELHETVKSNVIPCSPGVAPTVAHTTTLVTHKRHRSSGGANGSFLGNEEKDTGLCIGDGSCNNSNSACMEAANPRSYFFELSQVAKVSPPMGSPSSSVWGVEPVWYSHSTPSLVVECLLKCAAEEACLADAAAWAFLYCGRHLNTEAGKEMLGRDLLYAPLGSRAASTIALCAFRKF